MGYFEDRVVKCGCSIRGHAYGVASYFLFLSLIYYYFIVVSRWLGFSGFLLCLMFRSYLPHDGVRVVALYQYLL